MALPGGYTPASIALRVIGTRKPLLDKAVVLEEDWLDHVFMESGEKKQRCKIFPVYKHHVRNVYGGWT
jgi:hypothetical protein